MDRNQTNHCLITTQHIGQSKGGTLSLSVGVASSEGPGVPFLEMKVHAPANLTMLNFWFGFYFFFFGGWRAGHVLFLINLGKQNKYFATCLDSEHVIG